MSIEKMPIRGIERTWKVDRQSAGPGHDVGMVLEPGKWAEHDPFLLMAEDWFEQGTFDVHPHRGIETVTYVIEGRLTHYDNQFGEGVLEPGDVQWMTAGRGVIHKEDPMPNTEVHSLQLWVNLPSVNKMTEPRYQNLRKSDMPTRTEEGVTIRVFSGKSGTAVSETQNYVPVTMVDIEIAPGKSVAQELPESYRGFVYILSGSGYFGRDKTHGTQGNVLWLADGSGSSDGEGLITIEAETALKVLLYAGEPVREPVVQYGPFVMNTMEEIKQAFADYQSGQFV